MVRGFASLCLACFDRRGCHFLLFGEPPLGICAMIVGERYLCSSPLLCWRSADYCLEHSSLRARGPFLFASFAAVLSLVVPALLLCACCSMLLLGAPLPGCLGALRVSSSRYYFTGLPPLLLAAALLLLRWQLLWIVYHLFVFLCYYQYATFTRFTFCFLP